MGSPYRSIEIMDKTDWSISLEEFEYQLKQRWPEAEKEIPEWGLAEGEMPHWNVPTEAGEITVELLNDFQTVFTMSHQPLLACAKIALWYRKLVPIEHRLIIDAEYFGYVEIKETTDEDYIWDQRNWIGADTEIW